jgi:hypothetical protein
MRSRLGQQFIGRAQIHDGIDLRIDLRNARERGLH